MTADRDVALLRKWRAAADEDGPIASLPLPCAPIRKSATTYDFSLDLGGRPRAYPNYFLDTRVFVDLLNQIIAPAPKRLRRRKILPAGEDSAAGT